MVKTSIKVGQYIRQHLPLPFIKAAVNLVSKITKKTRGLAEHPGIGAPLSFIVDVQTNYRFFSAGSAGRTG